MEPFFPFVLLGLAVGLLIWGVSNLSVEGKYTKLFATSATAVGVAVLGWFFTTYGKGGPLYAVFSGLLLVPGRDVAGRVFGVRLHDEGTPPRSKKRHGDDFHFVHWRTLESDASLFS